MIVIAVCHEKQHVSSNQEKVFIIMTRHGISPKLSGSDVFGLLWHSPRVFLIVFDRVQANTNGIIYMCWNTLCSWWSDRSPYLGFRGLERERIHFEAHPYGRYWHLAQKFAIAVKHGVKETAASALTWMRVTYSIYSLPPLINQQRGRRCFDLQSCETQHKISSDSFSRCEIAT